MQREVKFGEVSIIYRGPEVWGRGISSSSNYAVLYSALQLRLRSGAAISPKAVAAAALGFERQQVGGFAVAADDVYPIAHGGVLKVWSVPGVASGQRGPAGAVGVEQIAHDSDWLSECVLVAINPNGKRHHNPDLLPCLIRHPKAGRYVEDFSDYAKEAAEAIRSRRIQDLAAAVNRYRQGFDEWNALAEGAPAASGSARRAPYTRAVAPVILDLERRLPTAVLGWKPPGGGGCESVIVLSPDSRARDSVIRFFQERGWVAFSSKVTPGVREEFGRADGSIHITAGHRLDFVGAADLGLDPAIGKAGVCCSCAIEPRSEIVASFA